MLANQKQCPQCLEIVQITASACSKCGHLFSTSFQPALSQTIAISRSGKSNAVDFLRSNLKWMLLAAFAACGLYVAYSFAVGSPLASTWSLTYATRAQPNGSAVRMVLRKDHTGEFQAMPFNQREKDYTSGFKPFRWHTEGSILFIEPVEPTSEDSPVMIPYKLFDQNRYLSARVEGFGTLWRRSED